MYNVFFALSLTLIAGLATGAGGLIVLFSNINNKKFLSICLSFSAGVMLYVAFAEILTESIGVLEDLHSERGYFIATLAFFAGIGIMAVIDRFMPHSEDELKRTGIMSAVAIAIHNFPEGIITFMAAVYDPVMGIAIAIAIIIHNIPEALAMASPIYYSTRSKKKAFLISLGAGLVQPLGALVAWFFMQNIFTDMGIVFGVAFAAVAGIMVFVAVHQLLPAAHKFGKHHSVMKWLFAGMAVMAASLVILEYVL
ncbi:MAG: zinc transporter ZupT [Defluviitaleaceae bacterium]|nr:zinc transporter ZupT [Defluviitaleaceae bacterium]